MPLDSFSTIEIVCTRHLNRSENNLGLRLLSNKEIPNTLLHSIL